MQASTQAHTEIIHLNAAIIEMEKLTIKMRKPEHDSFAAWLVSHSALYLLFNLGKQKVDSVSAASKPVFLQASGLLVMNSLSRFNAKDFLDGMNKPWQLKNIWITQSSRGQMIASEDFLAVLAGI